ncbi:MAG: sporulation protein YqfD [Bacilli bacterium]|nr:sporulation protein YqfD [Bacilli bacterium]
MIIIKVKNNTKRFIKKCLTQGIDLYNIVYEDSYILVTIKESDLKQIKKLNYYSKITKYKTLGKKKIILNIKNNLYNIFLLILFIVVIFGISNIIVKVEIKHENKYMIERIDELLKEKGIKSFTLYKSNNTLNKISDEITQENREFIDFLSITRTGMKYTVNIEERIIRKEEETKERCHIIAKKNGVITSIDTKTGVTLIEKGKLVNKGDILISGEIILNEEIKGNVCASGDIKANTWYKINISYPLTKTIKKYTKREKVNIKMYDKYFKKRLYENFDEKDIFKVGALHLVRQKEYTEETVNITHEDAKNLAIEEALVKLKEKLGEIQIIDKKVLNSSTNNSKIELELFVSVNESIGEIQEYEGREKIDTNESVQHTN